MLDGETSEGKANGDGGRISIMFERDSKGRVPPIAWNVYMAFRNHDQWVGVLKHNLLTESDEYHAGDDGHNPMGYREGDIIEIDDNFVFRARLWLEKAVPWSRMPAKDLVYDAIDAVCRARCYHPIREYLAELPAQWDGKHRIDHWLADYCGADDSQYTRAIGRKFLIAACERAFRPGCKVDTMLVLVGDQGVRKSTLIRTLGGKWTADTPIDIGGKDGYEALRGGWLIEIAELAGMGGKDVEKLKAFFSSPEDVYRPPYGRKPVRRKRSCVFIGTTNDRDFLKDATGSRRFWCVRVDGIDIDGLKEVVDQLWAEAALAALEGAPWWLDEEEARLAEEEAEEHTSIDPWEAVIRKRLMDSGAGRVHTEQIYEWVDVPVKDRHAGTAQRIVRIMCGRLNWDRPRNAISIGGVVARGFRMPVGFTPRQFFNPIEARAAEVHSGYSHEPQSAQADLDESEGF